jgi:transcriptional regulator with XRE-family HTH domain
MTVRFNVPGLGERIKAARLQDPRSVRQLAESAEISENYWYRLEAERRGADIQLLRRIEQVLGVDLNIRLP